MVETGDTEPTVRRASRVLAMSDQGRVLMLRGGDPARPGTHIWHTPGGGVETGESDAEAAVREFREETGRTIEVGALVWDRVLDFSFNFEQIHQYELFFTAEVGAEFEPDSGGHNEIEQQYLTGHGWFTSDELRAVGERDLLAPPDIADRLDDLRRDGPPAVPVRVLVAVLP